ncbi:MAG: DNA methyltransferase [Candidatus Aenigmatarchaeota archaeon]
MLSFFAHRDIYVMHKYWAKKPPDVISHFIERYARVGDIVLDPFSGYGTTGIEALRLGRRAVLVDINPVATFISKVIITPIDLGEVEHTFSFLRENVKQQIERLYRISCPRCKKDSAIASHTIWQGDRVKKIWYECSDCKIKKGEFIPSAKDLGVYSVNITYDDIPFWYPRSVKLFNNSRINSRANMDIREFFTPRNLYAMSLLYNELEKIDRFDIREFFKFVFTGALPQMSNMIFVLKNRGKFNGRLSSLREEIGSWVTGYWIPPEHFEINVWRCFENRYRKVIKGKKEAVKVLNEIQVVKSYDELVSKGKGVIISTASATNLSFLPDGSIDYIITDPPHGDRIPYLELSALWASWLGLDLDYENEIVISDAKERNKDIDNYKKLLYDAFKEMHRVLKDKGFISIIFNTKNSKIWSAFLDVVISSGFEIMEISTLDYSPGSLVQNTRKYSLKSDFVFTCKK